MEKCGQSGMRAMYKSVLAKTELEAAARKVIKMVSMAVKDEEPSEEPQDHAKARGIRRDFVYEERRYTARRVSTQRGAKARR